MSDERRIADQELLDVAQDLEQARRLRRALKTLADDPAADGTLKEMARHVLAGRVGMKDALADPVYSEALGGRVQQIMRAAREQTPEQREAQRETAHKWLAEQAREEADEDAAVTGPPAPQPIFGTRPRHRP